MNELMGRYRNVLGLFARDEEGAVMTEYVIMVMVMVVAAIWMSKASDAILFGENPYLIYNGGSATENIDADIAETSIGSWIDVTGGSAGSWDNNKGPENAYLGQVSIHLARP